MEIGEETLFVRQLAYEWAKVDLPTQHLSYGDYMRAVTGLQESTNNMAKTRTIFKRYFSRLASWLSRRSGWSGNCDRPRLRFEALAEFIEDRRETLRLELAHGGVVDDAALDLYNERVSRFT